MQMSLLHGAVMLFKVDGFMLGFFLERPAWYLAY